MKRIGKKNTVVLDDKREFLEFLVYHVKSGASSKFTVWLLGHTLYVILENLYKIHEPDLQVGRNKLNLPIVESVRCINYLLT